ncbi:MAG TPA: argininosuccinate lyase, partial [Terriglobia bacterium]
PFRQAHEVVGKIVREAERLGTPWTSLTLEKLRSFSPLFDESLSQAITLESALAARAVAGGTAAENVRTAIADCRQRLDQWESRK